MIGRVTLMRGALLVTLVGLVGASCRDHRARPPLAWPAHRAACPAPSLPRGEWRHRRSALVAATGQPRHVATDLVIAAGTEPVLSAKLSYGALSKDLEGEPVVGFVASDGCQARQVGRADTDDDGRVAVRPGRLAAGFHRFWLVVAGDNTAAEGAAWVLPGPTPAVVFDVDGTLTLDDGELLDDLVGSGAQPFEGAARVVEAWAARGYLVIYLTGRPYPLRARTRRWLVDGGFPDGPLFTPDRLRQAIPSRDRVGGYKRDTLRQVIAAGVEVVRAYGNADTDVCAYAEAGVDPARTLIVGGAAGCDGRPAPVTLSGYVDHLAEVERQPPAGAR